VGGSVVLSLVGSVRLLESPGPLPSGRLLLTVAESTTESGSRSSGQGELCPASHTLDRWTPGPSP
jgi:hypothetical protein